ncbi:MAG: GDSL-type esterase/lipase family protein [Bacteroidota bacterium]
MKSKLLILSLFINFVSLVGLLFLIQKLGGPRYILFKMRHLGVAGVYEHKKSIQADLSIDSTDIVFMGNSITAQGPWVEFFDQPRIKNRGIEGDVTQGILERLAHMLKTPPAQLFLLIGINDLIANDPAHVLKNYRRILEELAEKAPQTQVIIQSIYPVNDNLRKNGIDHQDILDINTELEKMVAEFGMIYVDLHPLLANAQGKLNAEFSIDGIHLNSKGYAVVRKALEPYVNAPNTGQ